MAGYVQLATQFEVLIGAEDEVVLRLSQMTGTASRSLFRPGLAIGQVRGVNPVTVLQVIRCRLTPALALAHHEHPQQLVLHQFSVRPGLETTVGVLRGRIVLHHKYRSVRERTAGGRLMSGRIDV